MNCWHYKTLFQSWGVIINICASSSETGKSRTTGGHSDSISGKNFRTMCNWWHHRRKISITQVQNTSPQLDMREEKEIHGETKLHPMLGLSWFPLIYIKTILMSISHDFSSSSASSADIKYRHTCSFINSYWAPTMCQVLEIQRCFYSIVEMIFNNYRNNYSLIAVVMNRVKKSFKSVIVI